VSRYKFVILVAKNEGMSGSRNPWMFAGGDTGDTI